MAKNKNRTIKAKAPELPPPSELLSPRGKALVIAGGSLVVLGFLVLSRADAMGKNWAATVSPFLILGGYAAIGVGLFLPPAPPAPPAGA